MKTVLLTGISGYIALHCAALLLKEGYVVRGSVRSYDKKSVVLQTLKKASIDTENLEFVELNLSSDQGWDQAITGCDYIMHVASPYHLANPKNEMEVIAPAVEGTIRVLEAAKKAKIKRVVLTSSLLSMIGDKIQGSVSPDDWTLASDKKINTYMKSKALAEKAAWDFVQKRSDNNFELVTINPGAVMGPPLGHDITGQSMSMIDQMLKGKMPFLANIKIPMVDVRDVALLHQKALTHPKVAGKRIIASHSEPHGFVDVAKVLINNGYKGPKARVAPNFMIKALSFFDGEIKGLLALLGRNLRVDNSIAREVLQWEPINFKKTVLDTAEKVKSIN